MTDSQTSSKRVAVILAVYAVLALVFAIAVGLLTGGTASAIMALIGAGIVGVILWLVLRAFTVK